VSAGPGGAGGEIEEQRVVRPPAAGRQPVHLVDDVERHAPAVALIGFRRVGETVAEHVTAGGERRLDHLDQVLTPAGEDEQQLDHAVDRPPPVVEEDGAQGVAERRPSRLVGDQMGDLAPGQPFGGAAQMGRLAAAVEALEGDEQGRHGEGTLPSRRAGTKTGYDRGTSSLDRGVGWAGDLHIVLWRYLGSRATLTFRP